MNLIDKLFSYNAWGIGYRLIDTNDPLPMGEEKIRYETIPICDHMYYADPFVVESDGHTYLFVESMNRYRGRGTISVSEYKNGKWSAFTEIIKESFHLSYPNVFFYNGTYYMMPESSEAKQIRLYKATQFPYEWKLDAVLLSGLPYVDTSLYIWNDRYILFCYSKNAGQGVTEVYGLDMNNRKLIQENVGSIQNERPAGNPFETAQFGLLRPLQDCTYTYGGGVFLVQHEIAQPEKVIGEITPTNIDLENRIQILGTHTINRSEHMEVIDYKYTRVCLTKPIIKVAGKITKHRRK